MAGFGTLNLDTDDEHGTGETNRRKSPAVLWKRLKEGEDIITECWDMVDEEEDPLPPHNDPNKFTAYPADAYAKLDVSKMDDAEYLRGHLQTLSEQLQSCRADLLEQESARIQADWGHKMAQQKCRRLQAFIKYIVEEVARPMVLSQAEKEYGLFKREQKVHAREKALKDEEAIMSKERTNLTEFIGLVRKAAATSKADLERLRENVLENDERIRLLRFDVMSEEKEDWLQELSEHRTKMNQELLLVSADKRALEAQLSASVTEKEKTTSEALKSEYYNQGYSIGEAAGKKIEAVEQYLRGYDFGAKDANKIARQNIDAEYQRGKEEGIRSAQEERVKLDVKLREEMREEVERAKQETEEQVTAELTDDFAKFWHERELVVRQNYHAYGLYEGAMTQIRLRKKVATAVEEEDALTSRIASILAIQWQNAIAENTLEKTPWFNVIKEDSPICLRFEYIIGTSFWKGLVAKIAREQLVVEERINAARAEQGSLPPVIYELPKDEEACKAYFSDMVKEWMESWRRKKEESRLVVEDW
ncbi:hypothetical protein ACJQWK_04108 [Exserohilum turcicum]|uniref:Uncharacterized protein n=1 Tax=Exserohilum turcicum (strain 28A) TaxID=671987 RepID=R0KWI0_EXST2|nr:uncharacterized protein SETTUDRAFT_18721 [Exserohilum turcica Et28A]EOA92067.1 hypothetical protein SETTUDRAFT_18721 [Exserohilum turcica Et28A]